MMVVCCALLLGALFLGGSSLSLGGYFWLILIGVFVIVHVWMMFRGHGKHGDAGTKEKTDGASKSGSTDEHKHGGCCH